MKRTKIKQKEAGFGPFKKHSRMVNYDLNAYSMMLATLFLSLEFFLICQWSRMNYVAKTTRVQKTKREAASFWYIKQHFSMNQMVYLCYRLYTIKLNANVHS